MYLHIHIYACIYSIHARTYSIYIYMYIYVCIYIYIYIYTHRHRHIYVHIHTHMHIYACIYSIHESLPHTHTPHTYIQRAVTKGALVCKHHLPLHTCRCLVRTIGIYLQHTATGIYLQHTTTTTTCSGETSRRAEESKRRGFKNNTLSSRESTRSEEALRIGDSASPLYSYSPLRYPISSSSHNTQCFHDHQAHHTHRRALEQ